MCRTLLILLCTVTGCTGSRWARQDPDYAAKYPVHTDSIPRMIKQAVDARHLRDKGGTYFAVGANEDSHGYGGEFGMFHYPHPGVENRFGISGLIYDDEDNPVSGGFVVGKRIQAPSRFAPFFGMGGYLGLTPPKDATADGIDNDDDGFVDNGGETTNEFVGALAPEIGCHYWLTPEWRITGSASYLITTAGRDDDFLMFNISLSHLANLGKSTSHLAKLRDAQRLGWKVGDGPGVIRPVDYQKPEPREERDPLPFNNLVPLPSVTTSLDGIEDFGPSAPEVNAAYAHLPLGQRNHSLGRTKHEDSPITTD